MYYQTKDLLHLQTDLIDTKVELNVSRTINQVVDQIISLRQEVHQEMTGLRQEINQKIGELQQEMHQEIGGLRQEMHQEIGGLKDEMQQRFSQVEGRLSSVETALGVRNQVRGEVRTRFFDYTFKAGWLVFGAAITYVFVHMPTIIR